MIFVAGAFLDYARDAVRTSSAFRCSAPLAAGVYPAMADGVVAKALQVREVSPDAFRSPNSFTRDQVIDSFVIDAEATPSEKESTG